MQACSELGHNGKREDLFPEMAYCICAVRDRFESAKEATDTLKHKGLLFSGDKDLIEFYLSEKKVLGYIEKANRIIEARRRFFDNGCEVDIRELVTSLISMPQKEVRKRLLDLNISGLGPKGCSHFLRNIGHGDELAILDGHILRTLCECALISEIPKSLRRSKYLEIEGE